MKKIARLKESDINRIVKKTILSENESSKTFKFRADFSDNLRRIEMSATDGNIDKLEDIVDVYKTHIKFIQDYVKDEKDRKKDKNKK